MSRLDYVTIAIVAVCVAALVYLIYMTTNLLGDSGEPEAAAESATPSDGSEDQEDDTYVFDRQNSMEDESQAGTVDELPADDADASSEYNYQKGGGLDKGSSSSGSSTPSAAAAEPDTRTGGTADQYTTRGGSTSTSASSSAPYMVIGGTFKNRSGAEQVAKDLRGLGYNNVSLESFDRGVFTVVLVDRFNSLSEAQSLVKELKSKGKDAFVKEKQ